MRGKLPPMACWGMTVAEPTVIVEVKSDVLGDSEFWRGPPSCINEIRNIPARNTARLVIKDGKARRCGMWHVRIEPAAGVGGAGPSRNNCATCRHKQHPDGGHCYMFRVEPEGVCMKHTVRCWREGGSRC